VRRRKLDVSKLSSADVCQQLQSQLETELPPATDASCHLKIEETWCTIKDVTYKVASKVLGHKLFKHKDWFDEQDVEARALLDAMYSMHLSWINDKNNTAKKKVYAQARSRAQSRLREMKDQWWRTKSSELQAAADRHDLKSFYQGLKAVYGPKQAGSAPVRSIDGSLLTDKIKIQEHWVEHFHAVLNQHSDFNDSVLSELPELPTASYLDVAPTIEEVRPWTTLNPSKRGFLLNFSQF